MNKIVYRNKISFRRRNITVERTHLGLAAFFFFALVLSGCFAKTPPKINPETRTFTDKDIGFSIALPEGWTLSLEENRLFVAKFTQRDLPIVTLTGLAIGGASTIGVAEGAFSGQGLGAGWYAISWAISAFIIAFVSSVQFRKLNLVTVPELFRRYFDQSGYVACIIVQVLMQLTITSLQYVAGGAILSQLLPAVFPNMQSGMIFSAIIFISLTFIGGLWSASLTNVLNVALIYGGTNNAPYTTL